MKIEAVLNYLNRQKYLMIILVLMVFFEQSYSQSHSMALYPTFPTSPQAASFKKYGDMAINPATGIPDISIPLYEIDHYGYKIPIVLKYNPQPIKYLYNFDIYGYGWGLSLNSSISRQINYLPDERADFELETPNHSYYNGCDMLCQSYYNYARDLFTVMLPDGSSFEFYIVKKEGLIDYLVSGERQVKIETWKSGMSLDWFRVTDDNGIIYTFDVAESGVLHSSIYSPNPNVAWQLSRIDFPHTPYPILLTNGILMDSGYAYSCSEAFVRFGASFDSYWQAYSPSATLIMGSGETNSYKMHLLEKIRFGPNGRSCVSIAYGEPSGATKNYVTKIQVLEGEQMLREIIFDGFETTVGLCPPNNTLRRLRKLTVKGTDDSVPEIYRFDYSSIGVGGGRDHWGYLNGSAPHHMPNFTLFVNNEGNFPLGNQLTYSANATSISKLPTDVSPLNKYRLSGGEGSDPKASSQASAHGILEKITYPTGGFTTFNFEMHKFLSQTGQDGDFIHDKSQRQVKSGGGIRIRRITDYSSAGKVSGFKNFRYGQPTGVLNESTGLGEAVVDPTIMTYMDFSSYMDSYFTPLDQLVFPIPYLLLGLDENGIKQPYPNPFFHDVRFINNNWYWEVTFSAINFRRLLGERPPVVYDEVTIYDGGSDGYGGTYPLGKTTYYYDTPFRGGPNNTGEASIYYGNMVGYEKQSYRYNRLLKKTEYEFDEVSGDFIRRRTETNEWSYFSYHVPSFQYCNWFDDKYWFMMPLYRHRVNDLYTQKMDWIGGAKLASTTVTEYNRDGDSLVNFIRYDYNLRHQLIKKTLDVSALGNVRYENYRYPEYSNPPEDTPTIIGRMLSANMYSPVLESWSVLNAKKTQGTKVEYGIFDTAEYILPKRLYELEARPTGAEYAFRYEVTSYTNGGRPREIVTASGIRTSYLWGYGDRYIVAIAENATFEDVYFDSFEEVSNWDNGLSYDSNKSRTGRKSARLDRPGTGELTTQCENWLTISSGSNRKFRYSGWVYSEGPTSAIRLLMKRPGETGEYSYKAQVSNGQTGKWVHLDEEYIVPADVVAITVQLANEGGGSVWFDDIRLHPSDTQMTTYTYDPLVGITSMTDVRNGTFQYEYDGLQRLKVIRDRRGNIVNGYDYHFRPHLP